MSNEVSNGQVAATSPPPEDHVAERRRQINSASLAIIATILSVGAVTYLGAVFQPVLVAVFVFFMMRPVANWLVRRGLREWVAWLTLFALVVLIGLSVTQLVYAQSQKVREYEPILEDFYEKLAQLSGYSVEEIKSVVVTEFLSISAGEVATHVFDFTFSFVELAILVFFYLMFVILDARDVPGRIRRAFPSDTADHLMHVGRSIIDGITEYVRVKTLVSAGMGISAGVLMWSFGVKYWQMWAFLTFLFNYVTYIGSLLILVPPIIVAIAFPSVGGITGACIFSALLCLNRFVWIDYVEIKHSGRSLNINSILILMSLAYWGSFWGVLGLILAVPMLTCVKIVLSNFESTKRLATLMTED